MLVLHPPPMARWKRENKNASLFFSFVLVGRGQWLNSPRPQTTRLILVPPARPHPTLRPGYPGWVDHVGPSKGNDSRIYELVRDSVLLKQW